MATGLTAAEADHLLLQWASAGIAVVFAIEAGDLACFIQRKGKLERPRPGIVIHRASETTTAVWPRRFGEIVFFEEGDWQVLRLRRPRGFAGCEIVLIADYSGELDAESILMLTQVADRQASAQSV